MELGLKSDSIMWRNEIGFDADRELKDFILGIMEKGEEIKVELP